MSPFCLKAALVLMAGSVFLTACGGSSSSSSASSSTVEAAGPTATPITPTAVPSPTPDPSAACLAGRGLSTKATLKLDSPASGTSVTSPIRFGYTLTLTPSSDPAPKYLFLQVRVHSTDPGSSSQMHMLTAKDGMALTGEMHVYGDTGQLAGCADFYLVTNSGGGNNSEPQLIATRAVQVTPEPLKSVCVSPPSGSAPTMWHVSSPTPGQVITATTGPNGNSSVIAVAVAGEGTVSVPGASIGANLTSGPEVPQGASGGARTGTGDTDPGLSTSESRAFHIDRVGFATSPKVTGPFESATCLWVWEFVPTRVAGTSYTPDVRTATNVLQIPLWIHYP